MAQTIRSGETRGGQAGPTTAPSNQSSPPGQERTGLDALASRLFVGASLCLREVGRVVSASAGQCQALQKQQQQQKQLMSTQREPPVRLSRGRTLTATASMRNRLVIGQARK